MEIVHTIDIDAPPSVVWEVMADVERWPEWTESMRSVRLLDGEGLKEGARARVRVLGGPEGTWTVSGLSEGREFTWESSAPGVRSVATHVIEPRGDGARVTLGIRQSGAGVWLLRPWLKRVGTRNVRMEAEGLKRAAEARAAAREGTAAGAAVR